VGWETFDQAAAFEGVDQGGHAGAADEQSLGDDMPRERFAGAGALTSLTPPKQHQYEKRCSIRDPDGHRSRNR
jgi:hypothetical protein